MKPKLIVCGAAGRMGKRLISLAIDENYFQIIAAIEKKGHPDINKNAGLIALSAPVNINITSDFPPNANAVIDFSQPDAIDGTIEYCLANNSALVLGTTGLGDSQHKKIKDASKKIPLIYGTNMSVGMNTLFSIVGKIASLLGPDYDIEIIEQHHRFKKDAPSGSALTLAENICKATGKNFPDSLVYGRKGKDAIRKPGDIGIHAVRAGDITGIHSVIFGTLGETVTLNHTAHSRDAFAKGALTAAKWLVGKKPALYTMQDVLGSG